jgi:hypothetical protein
MKCSRPRCTRSAYTAGLCGHHYRATHSCGFVDPTAARRHLEKLKLAGYGWSEIAHLSGLSKEGVRGVAHRQYERVTADTRDRILAVRVPAMPVPGKGLVPSEPSRRRIRALMAIGYPQPLIGEMLGKPTSSISRVLYRPWVKATTAAELAALYERISMTPGPSAVTRKRAVKRGFPPPLAWDRIDDLDAVPDVGEARVIYFKERYAEIRELESHPANIARRLGMTEDSLDRMLWRYGMKGKAS